jgi:hypothetical protein
LRGFGFKGWISPKFNYKLARGICRFGLQIIDMEALQKYLASLVIQVFFTSTDYQGSYISHQKPGRGRMVQFLEYRKNRTIQKKKSETIRWFHFLVNVHLLVLLVVGIFIPLTPAHLSLYYCACLSTGWLFYHTMDKYVTQAYHLKDNIPGQGYYSSSGLYALAGYNRKTRLGLLILVAMATVATFTAHLSFSLLTGFCLRWLLESQMQVLLAPPDSRNSFLTLN